MPRYGKEADIYFRDAWGEWVAVYAVQSADAIATRSADRQISDCLRICNFSSMCIAKISHLCGYCFAIWNNSTWKLKRSSISDNFTNRGKFHSSQLLILWIQTDRRQVFLKLKKKNIRSIVSSCRQNYIWTHVQRGNKSKFHCFFYVTEVNFTWVHSHFRSREPKSQTYSTDWAHSSEIFLHQCYKFIFK